MTTLPTFKLKAFMHNAHNESTIQPHIHSLSQVIFAPSIHGLGFVVCCLTGFRPTGCRLFDTLFWLIGCTTDFSLSIFLLFGLSVCLATTLPTVQWIGWRMTCVCLFGWFPDVYLFTERFGLLTDCYGNYTGVGVRYKLLKTYNDFKPSLHGCSSYRQTSLTYLLYDCMSELFSWLVCDANLTA